MNLLDSIKDGIDFIDGIPSIPALLIGLIVGALIPFKLLLLCGVGLAAWAVFKYVEL